MGQQNGQAILCPSWPAPLAVSSRRGVVVVSSSSRRRGVVCVVVCVVVSTYPLHPLRPPRHVKQTALIAATDFLYLHICYTRTMYISAGAIIIIILLLILIF